MIYNNCMTNDRFRQLINSLLDVIFPQYCLNCGASGELLCEKCLAAAPATPARSASAGLRGGRAAPQTEPICFNCEAASENGICPECARRFHIGNTRIFWATSYKYEPIRKLIRALKYRRAADAARLLAELIHSRLLIQHRVFNKFNKTIVIIPVPMHATRLRERGGNHAELIARELARLSGTPILADALVKIRPTHSQVEARSRAERLKNLARSFAVHDVEKIAGKNILLIDDVLTTGATIIECAKVLRAAGAHSVTVLVVAH